ncbi:uncharacterized protein LOC116578735 isoform X1 [Mustela erminea]|uniref:uncharacterized protein LOC116578735 isoform X1 n=1 Tax=Mustela erminea TaxID=36723 RepID=UPI0013867F95|nr:uncharacterized protein LOC116578735 isoform X1 [Mustela erminea]XP_032179047.1 uncharacterized protein LOC116578735 isoform X1 [Mustela erminea]XP_032179048.1 uncharacterized protein LOC116578735 isoform X1 [Mustela erminea]XP_032179049.1 uncharacterized protein LOC116578735 isoform X1 [Mustela erminea]XP_032179050.1 uncharacterized protein LOC116578735 isoform X1 [Mustela erminea]XP_032179051.1 uncharacterized protein LOC116578735 isoform X1 [Mustela erminea]XP_032179052.1 uncharacterize
MPTAAGGTARHSAQCPAPGVLGREGGGVNSQPRDHRRESAVGPRVLLGPWFIAGPGAGHQEVRLHRHMGDPSASHSPATASPVNQRRFLKPHWPSGTDTSHPFLPLRSSHREPPESCTLTAAGQSPSGRERPHRPQTARRCPLPETLLLSLLLPTCVARLFQWGHLTQGRCVPKVVSFPVSPHKSPYQVWACLCEISFYRGDESPGGRAVRAARQVLPPLQVSQLWWRFPHPVGESRSRESSLRFPRGRREIARTWESPRRFRKTAPSHSVALELFLEMPDQGFLRRALIWLQNYNQISLK